MGCADPGRPKLLSSVHARCGLQSKALAVAPEVHLHCALAVNRCPDAQRSRPESKPDEDADIASEGRWRPPSSGVTAWNGRASARKLVLTTQSRRVARQSLVKSSNESEGLQIHLDLCCSCHPATALPLPPIRRRPVLPQPRPSELNQGQVDRWYC